MPFGRFATMLKHSYLLATFVVAFSSTSVLAQEAKPPMRTRVGAGVQTLPRYPGADDRSLRPLLDVGRSRAGTPFAFSAADQGFGPALIRGGPLSIGPSANYESARDAEDVGVAVPRVGFTVEVGAFVQLDLSENFRLRVDGRKGLGGHRGAIGMASADFVVRDGDDWLFALGPRLTFADRRYNRAYFGVTPETAAATGLAAFDPSGGATMVGGASTVRFQITPRWGVYGYVKYDRLTGDVADSPLVAGFGSKDQFSAGVALNYTFGG